MGRRKYTIEGRTVAGRRVGVVCRYSDSGEQIVVIDDVPAYVCNRCGERYYDAEVAKRMRALARQR